VDVDGREGLNQPLLVLLAFKNTDAAPKTKPWVSMFNHQKPRM
jgi:hypothetical protein